jgi:hypothetical protein
MTRAGNVPAAFPNLYARAAPLPGRTSPSIHTHPPWSAARYAAPAWGPAADDAQSDLREHTTYKIVNAKAGTALDVSGTDGRTVSGWTFHGSENQRVRPPATPDCTPRRLTRAHSGG